MGHMLHFFCFAILLITPSTGKNSFWNPWIENSNAEENMSECSGFVSGRSFMFMLLFTLVFIHFRIIKFGDSKYASRAFICSRNVPTT